MDQQIFSCWDSFNIFTDESRAFLWSEPVNLAIYKPESPIWGRVATQDNVVQIEKSSDIREQPSHMCKAAYLSPVMIIRFSLRLLLHVTDFHSFSPWVNRFIIVLRLQLLLNFFNDIITSYYRVSFNSAISHQLQAIINFANLRSMLTHQQVQRRQKLDITHWQFGGWQSWIFLQATIAANKLQGAGILINQTYNSWIWYTCTNRNLIKMMVTGNVHNGMIKGKPMGKITPHQHHPYPALSPAEQLHLQLSHQNSNHGCFLSYLFSWQEISLLRHVTVSFVIVWGSTWKTGFWIARSVSRVGRKRVDHLNWNFLETPCCTACCSPKREQSPPTSGWLRRV